MGMQKILRGVMQYRATVKPGIVKQLKAVSDHPKPKALVFSCMDSRMLPTRFTQTDIGDIFFVRNPGNVVVPSNLCSLSDSVEGPAALDMACNVVKVKDVVVLGHSDCKAMNALYSLCSCTKHKDDDEVPPDSPVSRFLNQVGMATIEKFEAVRKCEPGALHFKSEVPSLSFRAFIDPEKQLSLTDKLSQVNTLQQLVNLSTHTMIKPQLHDGRVRLHAMWFDIFTGNMFIFSSELQRFIEIREDTIDHLLSRVKHNESKDHIETLTNSVKMSK
ncbi:beta carbonic anhydrase 1-like [Anneissia japonica]|uniref:beta carbonic anhydrase 1-like n=1 Tax=Anneissia japonica TaxID=1529436 RepID=UPI001425B904|nr:beta carbonic anhydrase 1-like [Anneissia japonica]